jgi:hypothetical protein
MNVLQGNPEHVVDKLVSRSRQPRLPRGRRHWARVLGSGTVSPSSGWYAAGTQWGFLLKSITVLV